MLEQFGANTKLARWWVVGPVFLAGALLRLLYLAVPEIDADMAMWGVLAMEILEGRPQFFFAGELFGGALEAWLAAPLFWLFEPGRLLLCLVPFSFSLGLVWLVWRLARREMEGPAALAALAWAACAPWMLLSLGVKPLGAYIEVPFLTVVCFGLTLNLGRQTEEKGRGRQTWPALALGLAMGLGLWSHLLMLPAMAACGLYLLAARPRAFFLRLCPLILAGLAVGGAPLWLVSLPAGLLRPEVLAEGHPLRPGLAWSRLWAEGLPVTLGLVERIRIKADWGWWQTGVWVLYGLPLLATLLPAARRPGDHQPSRPGLPVLVALYLAVYLAAWLFSGTYNPNTWRHLMPLYAGLPFLAGLVFAGLRRRLPALAWVWLGLALGVNLWGGLTQAPWLDTRTRQAFQEHQQARGQLFAWLQESGHLHGYAQGFWEALPLTLDSGDRILFADQVENHIPRLTHEADAEERPFYTASTRAVDLKNTLRAAGVGYGRKEIAQYQTFHNFRSARPALRELSPRLWSSPQPGAAEAWDRDLATGWTLAQPQTEGQILELDLGREEPGLCLVSLMPGAFIQAAKGLEVQTSLDGRQWTTVASHHGFAFAPLFWSLDRPLVRFLPARQQLAFPPTTARRLRIVQTGRAPGVIWSVGEVFIHQADGDPRPAPPARELARAAQELSPRGPIYAPPEVLALLPEETAGLRDPQRPRADSFPLEKLIIPLRPETVLCLPLANWPASLEAMRGLLARPPEVREMGDQALVSGLEALPPTRRLVDPPATARLAASHSPDKAGLALDGESDTRWDTGRHQEPGPELRLDLGGELEIAGLALEAGPWPQDRPRGLTVLVSRDGRDWREPEGLTLESPAVVWGGDRVLRGGGALLARFDPQRIRHARLVQTGRHPYRFWSVSELKLLVSEGPGPG